MPIESPILVAGSGPAGSTLALALAQAGLPVCLLEAEDDLPVDLRASTFHPASLDLLDTLGVTEAMIAKGLIVNRYQYRDRQTGEVAEFDMSLIAGDTRHPYRLQLEQYELTRIIREKLKEYPEAQHLFGHRATGARQDGEIVRVEVETPDGPREFETPYLIGADGASSVVRKAASIDYGGFTYNEKFLVASTTFPFEDVFENLAWVNYVADPDEWCVILRTDKIWRVLWPTDPENPDDDHYLSDAHIQERLQHLHAKDGDYEIGHRTLYRVHQRVAERYVDGRIILVGDSAHINNPLGGMGMNGGLHDAFNLADQLWAIHGGASADACLERYDRQRRELAVRFVQEHTIQNKKLMESNDPDVMKKRQAWLMETAADPVKARAFIRERAMIDCLEDSLAEG